MQRSNLPRSGAARHPPPELRVVVPVPRQQQPRLGVEDGAAVPDRVVRPQRIADPPATHLPERPAAKMHLAEDQVILIDLPIPVQIEIAVELVSAPRSCQSLSAGITRIAYTTAFRNSLPVRKLQRVSRMKWHHNGE
jgi:hypothetical protein